jgi:hypothetical protein
MSLGNCGIASRIRNDNSTTANMQNDHPYNEDGCDCGQPNPQ